MMRNTKARCSFLYFRSSIRLSNTGSIVLVGPVWTSWKGDAAISVVHGNEAVAGEGMSFGLLSLSEAVDEG
jgi:hypothetical protein